MTNCSVYVGNLDERVSDRVLYNILIQVGHVIDLHIPRDKETNNLKGFAFVKYETEEIAEYAVKLFSDLVILYKKTLKFSIARPMATPPIPTRPRICPSRRVYIWSAITTSYRY